MLFIIGLILIFCGPWFDDQQTVGAILLIPAVIEAFIYLIFAGIIASLFKDK